jgi:hypothetical protein
MGIKHGRVVQEDTPGKDTKIRRFRLEDGAHVYLPLALCQRLLEHPPTEEIYFVERGLLGRTEWVGTIAELRIAITRGEVRERDLAGFRLPPSPCDTYGPSGEAVARLLAVLGGSPASQWEQLVAANDAADRARPPRYETEGSTAAGWVTSAVMDARDVALAVIDPGAVDAWRNGLIRSSMASRGRHVDPPSPEEWHLAHTAWRWQFAAEHMACLLTISAGRSLDSTERDWAPYEPIIPLQSLLRG